MKLYAVRDRLIDYYMQPFVGPSDKAVLSSIANVVNGDGNEPIAKKPEHFEVWRLAEIDEQTGQVGGEREFLADASSLLRRSIRPDTETGPGQGALADSQSRGARKDHRATPEAHASERAP